jgi:hypothetical protein
MAGKREGWLVYSKIGSDGRWKGQGRLEENGILADGQKMEILLQGWKTG